MVPMQGNSLLLTAALAVVALIYLIAVQKLNPFVTLIVVSLALGVVVGMPMGGIVKAFETGVGNTLGHIALVVGLGTMLGKMMAESGGAERIAKTLINAFGEKNAHWAMMVVAFIIGLPVFFEVGFVLLIPIAFNVAKRTEKTGALIGGEGSGGVILPALHLGRDAIVGIGLILQQLATFGGTLSALKASLPRYEIVKSKIELPAERAASAIGRLHEAYAARARVNTDDGLRLDLEDGWVHLRRSNTEPIVRIIAEAPSVERARALVTQFQQELQQG